MILLSFSACIASSTNNNMPTVMATIHVPMSEAMAAKPSGFRFDWNERMIPNKGSTDTMSQHNADIVQYKPSNGIDVKTWISC